MAVGGYSSKSGTRHSLAQIWTGKTWRVLKNPPGKSLTSVSCSAPWFCMASGGRTGTERWNGKAWLTMTGPQTAATAPSCGSRSLCMVINRTSRNGSGSVAESWNGHVWRTWWHASSVCIGIPGTSCGLADVACGSAINCVAVGTTQADQAGDIWYGSAVTWNGKGWSRHGYLTPGSPAGLLQVSCAGAFCATAGTAFEEIKGGDVAVGLTWNARTGWRDISPNLGVFCDKAAPPCDWTSVLSCGSPTNCMAFGPFGNLWWNGSAWQAAPSISAGRGSSLTAVSCRMTSCLAVGYRTISGVRHTLAELWNGRSWKILGTPALG